MRPIVTVCRSIVCLLAVGCASVTPAANSNDKLLRACTMDYTCKASSYAASWSSVAFCMYFVQAFALLGLNSDQQHDLDCAQQAPDCATASRCISRGHDPTYCAAHPGTSCDGAVIVTCPSATGWANATSDCGASGLQCRVVNGRGSCTTGTACDASFARKCEGNRLLYCDQAVTTAIDCSTVAPGWVCGTAGPAGMQRAECLPQGPSCSTTNPRCEGNDIVQCVQMSREVRVSCVERFDGTCRQSGTSAQCEPTANECTAGILGATPDRCNGNAIESCVNGRFRSTDCTSLGQRTCGTVNGKAICVP